MLATPARSASPTAPPIIWAVLIVPETRPLSVGDTSFVAIRKSGMKEMPAPRPSRNIGTAMSGTKAPSIGARANSSKPSVKRSMPATSGRVGPTLATIQAATPSDIAPMVSVAGRNVRPVCSASNPRMCWA